jgi:hypothetical protein
MKSEEIAFLLFTVKQTEESIYDVGVDLEQREYRIERTDLYGHMEGERLEGKLRKSKVKQFQEDVEDLGLMAWPENETHTLPIHLESASVVYSVEDERHFTTGNHDEDLSGLHRLIEQLVGTTFGSYEFYR